MRRDSKDFEQKKLRDTKDFIQREIKRLSTLRKDSRERAMSIGKKFADDNPYASVYGRNLTEHQNDIQRELDAYEQSEIDINMLEKLLSGPYFARIDFQMDETRAENTFYIGLKNLYDKESHKSLVSDWRAPVGELFYNEFDGPAYYKAPVGTIQGEILLKRQFKFEKGELKYFFDADMRINDEILGEALAENAENHLKVIVGSIQREQNTAIRFSDHENLIVFGPAGSGKTSIGLHRIAYLLYKNRSSLSSKDVMLFTASNVFSTYISNIIPELGEQDIIKKDFFEIVQQNIPPHFTIYDYYEQANRLLSQNRRERRREIELKYSATFLNFLQSYLAKHMFSFPDVSVYGQTIIQGEELLNRFESDREEFSLAQKSDRLISFCLKEIDAFFNQNEEFLYAKIEEEREPFDDAKQLFRILRKSTKQQARNQLNQALHMNEIDLYRRALTAYCEQEGSKDIGWHTRDRINRSVLYYEDALVILYIKAILGTLKKIKEPRHVLIDEAQDFCELQHKIILYLCPDSRFTLLADINQGILPSINTLSKEKLQSLYTANALSLQKSYRSTRQINECALKLLVGSEYEVFKREGEDIQVITGGGAVENIAKLINSDRLKGNSTCIVTKTVKQARTLYEKLSERECNIHLIDDRQEAFSKGIMVMPLVLTKGLEFDNVIIPFANSICRDAGENRILYLMVTRALHRLFVLFEDEPLFPFAN